ncbi:helix-turn-helix transcriptional regulator [Streptomyces sp. NPDC005805]|uniref:helix-turn-helix transcriptional regulator n=1 Tax=Streptomyces sp. NPDC005805 TaxID=3157068 RepID=UPI0033E6AA0D
METCRALLASSDGARAQLLGLGPESGAVTGVALVLLQLPCGAPAGQVGGWFGSLVEHLRSAGVFAEVALDNAVTLADEVPDAAVRRAMAYCAEHAGEPVSVADMAVAAGVSPRTLQDRFRSGLGTTPAAYLRRLRLDRAHRDLLRIADGSASGTVAEVATRWGFTHLSRFAAYYREAYGQVPSRTAERR